MTEETLSGATIAVRHWDHILPLALGDVAVQGADLRLSRRDATPNLWAETELLGGETSFSAYLHQRARGDDSITGLPVFLMQGFRHRCIISRSDGPTALEQLKGGRIGLTGWPDSGNVWTRAIFRRAGVEVADASWFVGPLTSEHPHHDRIGPLGAPANVQATAEGTSLVSLLRSGRLDAVLTPFMPPGFHEPGSGLRALLPDVRSAEVEYFAQVGYVPGIHLLGVRTSALHEDPTLGARLVAAFDASKQLAASRHEKLADVTPWLLDELQFTSRAIGTNWMPSGREENRTMIQDFVDEHREQGLLTGAAPSINNLFPDLEPALR